MNIIGIGMVTTLGYDAATSCAAARAGVVRSRVLDNFLLRSAVDGMAEPVIGHPVALLTRGFEGDARLLRLLQGALEDLLNDTPDFPWTQTPHRFYLSLPDSLRQHTGLALMEDEADCESRTADAHAAFAESPDHHEFHRAESLLTRAAALAHWPSPADLGFATISGHAGGIEALRAAHADMTAGKTQLAVVVGVDSLLDEETLSWLQVCGRLKCDAAPTGLQPGEAAAALLLAAPNTAAAGLRAARSHIVQATSASEANAMLQGKTSTGESLATVLSSVWGGTSANGAWIVSDHNGENYRASELGHAIVRLRAENEAFAAPQISYPVASFGDTGAASALLSITTVVHAFERGYALTDIAIVMAASDSGLRAAASVIRPHGTETRSQA